MVSDRTVDLAAADDGRVRTRGNEKNGKSEEADRRANVGRRRRRRQSHAQRDSMPLSVASVGEERKGGKFHGLVVHSLHSVATQLESTCVLDTAARIVYTQACCTTMRINVHYSSRLCDKPIQQKATPSILKIYSFPRIIIDVNNNKQTIPSKYFVRFP